LNLVVVILILLSRNLSGKKALSPVVATLLMVATVFAMFAILYPWATSSLMLYQSSANIWFSSKEDATKERIAVEMLLFNMTTNKTDVYVRNMGEIDVKIVAIYVNGSDFSAAVTPLLTGGCSIYAKTGIGQNTARFSVTIPSYSSANVRVVTARGSQVTSVIVR